MKKIIIILTILLLFFIGCGEEMTRAVEVNKLRVLAIKADKPQAYPGDEITIDALITAPEDYNKEYHKVWLVCDPNVNGESEMGYMECLNPSANNIIETPGIDQDQYNFTIPEDTLISYGFESKMLYVVLILCEDTADNCTNQAMENGFDPEKFLFTLKRVQVISEDKPIENRNPEFYKTYLNDDEITTDTISIDAGSKASKNIFKAAVTLDSFEKTVSPEGDIVDENIYFSWISTEGEFDFFYTDQLKDEGLSDYDENGFKAPKADASSQYKIYIVVQDNRGGVNWKVINVDNNSK